MSCCYSCDFFDRDVAFDLLYFSLPSPFKLFIIILLFAITVGITKHIFHNCAKHCNQWRFHLNSLFCVPAFFLIFLFVCALRTQNGELISMDQMTKDQSHMIIFYCCLKWRRDLSSLFHAILRMNEFHTLLLVYLKNAKNQTVCSICIITPLTILQWIYSLFSSLFSSIFHSITFANERSDFIIIVCIITVILLISFGTAYKPRKYIKSLASVNHGPTSNWLSIIWLLIYHFVIHWLNVKRDWKLWSE